MARIAKKISDLSVEIACFYMDFLENLPYAENYLCQARAIREKLFSRQSYGYGETLNCYLLIFQLLMKKEKKNIQNKIYKDLARVFLQSRIGDNHPRYLRLELSWLKFLQELKKPAYEPLVESALTTCMKIAEQADHNTCFTIAKIMKDIVKDEKYQISDEVAIKMAGFLSKVSDYCENADELADLHTFCYIISWINEERKGDFLKAEENILKGIKIIEKMNLAVGNPKFNSLMAFDYELLGQNLTAQKKFTQAEQSFLKALELYEKEGNMQKTAHIKKKLMK